jgi:hypothetical protein
LVFGGITNPGAERADVGAGVGLAHREGGECGLLGSAEALRDPLEELLGSAIAHDAGDSEGRAHDRHADTGVAPEELFVDQRHRETRLVVEGVGEEVHRVEADGGRLLDDRPRGVFLLVPLLAGGAHDVLCEVVDPLLHRELVLGETEIGSVVTHESTAFCRERGTVSYRLVVKE